MYREIKKFLLKLFLHICLRFQIGKDNGHQQEGKVLVQLATSQFIDSICIPICHNKKKPDCQKAIRFLFCDRQHRL